MANDNQLWKGFNGHGLYAKRAERDRNGDDIVTTYAKDGDVPALTDSLTTSTTTAVTPNAVKAAIDAIVKIPTTANQPSTLCVGGQGLGWTGWESGEIDVPDRILIYHTDFSNFDLATGIDTPLVGNPSQWTITGNVSKTTKNIDDTEYSAMLVQYGGRLSMDQDLTTQYPDCFSVEATLYKDSYAGLAGGAAMFGVTSPIYNCYSSGRGIGIYPWRGSVYQIFNDFYHIHDGYYYSDTYDHTEVRQVITGGVTVLASQNKVKAYLGGLKGLIDLVNPAENSCIDFYSDNVYGTDFYVLDLKIYTSDRFDEIVDE